MKKTLAALLSCLFLAAALPQPSLYAAETDAPEDSRITGDVNGDGKRNAADIVLMQQWLLQVPDTTLADWQAGDCNADGRLDGLGLCRMRQLLTAPALQNPLEQLVGMSYADAVKNGYISRSEYNYQISGNLKSTIETQMERPLDYSIDRFYLVSNETLGLTGDTK